MEAFTGEIRIFGFNYAPMDWAYCNGSTVQIAQYQALFTILTTRYGGNGSTTFNLPNLQGCVPIGQGAGPGLTTRTVGQVVGTEAVVLNQTNLPAHNHTANLATTTIPASKTPGPATTAPLSLGSSVLSNSVNVNTFVLDPVLPNINMNPNVIQPTGAAAPTGHENRQPFVAMNYCICMNGYYPINPN